MRIFGKRRFVVLAFTLLVLFWGSAFAVVKVGLGYSPPQASRVAACIFAVPLTAVLIGVVFLDEPPGYALLVGAALAVSGIYLVNRKPQRAKA